MANVNRNKKLRFTRQLFKDKKFNTKVKLFFSIKSFGDFYDEDEDNAEYIKLNPVTIKGYVHDITASTLVYKKYGSEFFGSREILADDKYLKSFQDCEKIEIDGKEYQVFKEAAGQNMIIHERAFNMIRVMIQRRTQ